MAVGALLALHRVYACTTCYGCVRVHGKEWNHLRLPMLEDRSSQIDPSLINSKIRAAKETEDLRPSSLITVPPAGSALQSKQTRKSLNVHNRVHLTSKSRPNRSSGAAGERGPARIVAWAYSGRVGTICHF